MRCRWFAKCDNEATRVVMVDLPGMDDVPVCQQCSDQVARLMKLNEHEGESE